MYAPCMYWKMGRVRMLHWTQKRKQENILVRNVFFGNIQKNDKGKLVKMHLTCNMN